MRALFGGTVLALAAVSAACGGGGILQPEGTPDSGGQVASPRADPSPAAIKPHADLSSPTASEPAFVPNVALTGKFTGVDDFHFGRGNVVVIETMAATYTLQFDEFSVRNGQDLFVYLSSSAEGRAEGDIELGRLKATDGAFGYEIPAGTDVSRFKSAIIWSKSLSMLFAVAPLTPVQ